jgi:hypothetical protein
MSKSKVLSVRLSLESLQSCFDLCEALGMPTNGASGAIARSIETLTRDLRDKGTLPVYTHSELIHLVSIYLNKKNPTSMASLEGFSTVDRRTVYEHIPEQQTHYSGEDFAPVCSIEQPRRERSFEEINDEANEYKDLIEESILEQIQQDENDLLTKILIGG